LAFPVELEREIFELCALSEPGLIPKLMLAAQRAKEWLEPLLYRIIALGRRVPLTAGFPSFNDELLSSVIRRKPPSFFQSAVRHLMLYIIPIPDVVLAVVAVCTGVMDLWLLDIHDAWIPLIESLSLRRLCAWHFDLFSKLRPTHRVFSRLTHLRLGYNFKDVGSTCIALPALPHLTHLSLADDDAFAPICLRMLESLRHLCVLIFFQYDTTVSVDNEALPLLAHDVRFVVMTLDNFATDWHAGAQRGTDYWSRAEIFIAKRRTREMNPLQYLIPDDENINEELHPTPSANPF